MPPGPGRCGLEGEAEGSGEAAAPGQAMDARGINPWRGMPRHLSRRTDPALEATAGRLDRIENQQGANPLCWNDGALADTGAVTRDLFRPGLRAHVLGPEGPGPALRGSRLIDPAALPLEIRAGVREVLQVEMAVGLDAVLRGERPRAQPEVTREAATILQRHIDESVRTP